MQDIFSGKRVLITGGAGFVGSNLAHRLARDGAKITVLDNFHPDYGGNEYNLSGIDVKLVRGDIAQAGVLDQACADADFVFHMAAQCSHVDSMTDPWLDLEYNCKGTLRLLEAVRKVGRKTPIVYAGTRAILGAPLEMPTRERTLPNPVDVYGVNKHAAELYGSVFARVHGIPFVSMRLTNSYGIRHQMKNGKYGILNWFMSLAMRGQMIKIFGTGEQLRDYLHIDDAIDAFARAGGFAAKLGEGGKDGRVQLAGEAIPYAVFNIGSGRGMKFADCAKEAAKAGGGKVEFVPWPADRKAIETGDFIADGTAAKEVLGWSPKIPFEQGVRETCEWYKTRIQHYT